MAFVLTSGGIVPPEQAGVSASDAGLLHGVGLFETMLARRGQVHRLAEHLERLVDSAELLGLAKTLYPEPLGELVLDAARHASDEQWAELAGGFWRLRLTITGGDLNLLDRDQPDQPVHRPTILVHATPTSPPPAQLTDRGVAVGIADLRVNPFDPFESHKTLNYWRRLRALQDAASQGLGEAIVLQVTNHLAGGCVSNLFIVPADGPAGDGKTDRLLTPIVRGEEPKAGVPSPVLPGVARRAIIEQAHARGYDIARQMLSIDDLLDAKEAFLTSSTIGVLPIVAVEGKQLADGTPGPVTRELLSSWQGELAALGDDL